LATTNKLSRALTLKSRTEIDRLLKSGERKTGSYGTVAWEFSQSFRYAVLVSGKIKKAVARNRLKRLFREAIRLNRKVLLQPVNIAFLIRPITHEPGFDDINKEVIKTFEYISNQHG
jgi:ribonuclease P protein component